MGWISAVFAHRVIDVAAAGQGDGALAERLLSSVGLRPGEAADPEQMIDDLSFFGLLERIVDQAEHGRDVALRVGASMRCDDYGAFGLAFKSAVDLEGSYARVERYGRVVTSIANFRLVHGKESSFLEVISGQVDRPGLRLTNELALGAAAAISREVTQGDFVPLSVHLSLPEPERTSTFEEHFRCPIRFAASRDALEVSHELLARPNRLGDRALSRFIDAHLDGAISGLPEPGALGHRLRAEIAEALSEGTPTLGKMAARLGLSDRTLQRRLKESGLSYRALVDEARRDLADRLLSTTDFSLLEIAFLAGFSEQSAFNRAFRRWTGRTPRDHRQAMRSGPH